MWGCALGPLEASALMATSPRKEERKKKKDASKDVCPLVIAGTGSAYSGPQC